jgi:hypothetical protein
MIGALVRLTPTQAAFTIFFFFFFWLASLVLCKHTTTLVNRHCDFENVLIPYFPWAGRQSLVHHITASGLGLVSFLRMVYDHNYTYCKGD